MEGGTLDGLAAALHEQITVRDGQVVQSNFHDYPLLAMREAPDVEVEIVASEADPKGCGEMGIPTVAPALANAIYNGIPAASPLKPMAVVRVANNLADMGHKDEAISRLNAIIAANPSDIDAISVLGDLPWWVTVVMLGRELGVTGLRLWVIRRGVIPASRGGKIKTFLQGIAIGLYILPLTGWAASLRWWVMGVALIVTLVTGVDYVLRALALRRAPAR